MTRSYVKVHNDFWRLLAANPLVFVALPVAVNFVIDIFIAFITDGMGWIDYLRVGARLQQSASVVLGTYIAAVVVWTTKAMSEGHKPTLSESLSRGGNEWRSVLITSFHSGWRILLGLLFFVIPGIYLLVRYVPSVPVTVFENVRGTAALKVSRERTRGKIWTIFKWYFLSILIYLPLVLVLTAFLSTSSSEAWRVVLFEGISSMPISFAIAAGTLGTVVSYLECAYPEKLQAAVVASHVEAPSHVERSEPSKPFASLASTEAPWPWIIGLTSWSGAVFAFMTFVGIGMIPALIGSYYVDRQQFEEAKPYFDAAVRSDPENYEVRLRIGSALLNGETQEDKERSIAELTKAVELKPEVGEGHLLLAAAYFVNGRDDESLVSMRKAEELGVESSDLLEILKANAGFAAGETGIDGHEGGEESEGGALPLELEDY